VNELLLLQVGDRAGGPDPRRGALLGRTWWRLRFAASTSSSRRSTPSPTSPTIPRSPRRARSALTIPVRSRACRSRSRTTVPSRGCPSRCAATCSATSSPPTTRTLVRRLREAGFVIVGKTALPEMGILPNHRVAPVRPHPEPLVTGPDPRRLERRVGGRGRRGGWCRSRMETTAGARPNSGRVLWPGWAQARAGSGLGGAGRGRQLPGPGRSAEPDRGRDGPRPRPDRRLRDWRRDMAVGARCAVRRAGRGGSRAAPGRARDQSALARRRDRSGMRAGRARRGRPAGVTRPRRRRDPAARAALV